MPSHARCADCKDAGKEVSGSMRNEDVERRVIDQAQEPGRSHPMAGGVPFYANEIEPFSAYWLETTHLRLQSNGGAVPPLN